MLSDDADDGNDDDKDGLPTLVDVSSRGPWGHLWPQVWAG